MARRFANITGEELLRLQKKQNAKNTDRATKFGVNLLERYLVEVGNPTKIEDFLPHELNDILIGFYASARTEKGELYKLNSIKNLRFSIQRYYLEKVGVDIISGSMFKTSNICFSNFCKMIVLKGKAIQNITPK